MFPVYQKEKDFLICIDSDGCAMDSMNWKHHRCFGPAFVSEWELTKAEPHVLTVWNHVNLYSRTRGVNRFQGLCRTLELLEAEGLSVGDFSALQQWVKSAGELSNRSLKAAVESGCSPVLAKVLRWSLDVNERIRLAGNLGKPFEAALEVIPRLSLWADLIVVSSANREAVEAEWCAAGLHRYLTMVCTQELGSKAHCIARLLEKGYPRSNVLMVGDAVGDMEAARENGVLFYPIVVNRENESWQSFVTQGAEPMRQGHFDEQHQRHLTDAFQKGLRGM